MSRRFYTNSPLHLERAAKIFFARPGKDKHLRRRGSSFLMHYA